jgi:hypothetical protein
MILSEPTTLASDWLLAAVAAVLGLRLHRPGGQGGRARRMWALAFLAGAAAALAGGAVHGFAASLSPLSHAILWKAVLVGTGLAGSSVFAGVVLATFEGSCRSVLLAGTAVELAAYLAVVSMRDDVRHAVWHGALVIVAVLAVELASTPRDTRRLGWVLLGLGLAAAGLVAQRAGVAASVLNHNDVCHVLLTAALWPFFTVGRGLRDRVRHVEEPGPADAQRPSLSRKTALSRPASSRW